MKVNVRNQLTIIKSQIEQKKFDSRRGIKEFIVPLSVLINASTEIDEEHWQYVEGAIKLACRRNDEIADITLLLALVAFIKSCA